MSGYFEKELAIFRGIMSLIESGVSVPAITAQQIADAAGMGKATIYDYFHSKDQAINRAILHSLESQIKVNIESLSEKLTFKEKIYTVYENIIKEMDNSCSVYNIVLSFGGIPQFLNRFHTEDYQCPFNDIISRIFNMLGDVIAFGEKNGDIKPGNSAEYVNMVLMGNFFSVFCAGAAKKTGLAPQVDEIMENAYTILIKSLN